MATSVTKSGLVAAADKVILAAQPILEQLSLFTTDFALDAAKPGSGVAVEILSATAGDFGENNGYTKSTNKIAPITVTLNQHKKSTFTISDVDALENDLAPVWANIAPVAGRAIANALVAKVMNGFTSPDAAGKFTSACETLADFASIQAQAVKAGLDPADCTLVLNPEPYSKLLACLPVSVLGDNEAVRRGVVGAFLGFKAVIQSPNLVEFASDKGIVVPTGNVAIASRVVYPVREGGNLIEFGTIQDEKTGFTLGQRVVVDADQGTCSWTVDSLCGFHIGGIADKDNGMPRFYSVVAA